MKTICVQENYDRIQTKTIPYWLPKRWAWMASLPTLDQRIRLKTERGRYINTYSKRRLKMYAVWHKKSFIIICSFMPIADISNTDPYTKFNSGWYLYAWRSPYTFTLSVRCFHNFSFVLETVLMFVSLMKVLFCPSKEDCQALPLFTLSPPGNWWYNVFGFVPAGRVSSSTCWNKTDTCQSGLPIPLLTFCSQLTESVRADGMGVLSPLEVIQQTSSATDYTSVVKLEPSVYTIRSCGLPFSWIKSLIFESISPAGHSLISPAGHSQQCLPKFSCRNVS